MTRAILGVVVVALLAVAAPRRAHAYPQFQLDRDQTCTSCHLSPAGGGLLNENGLNVASGISQFGTDPAFLNGAFDPPSWLVLGGDLRALAGYFRAPYPALETFPMQAELHATAKFLGNFAVHVTAGMRPTEQGNTAATAVWAREHYVQWQQHADEPDGLYVRAGHFMPVFGLRLAEHQDYTRRFGGTPLDADTYGVAAEYVDQQFEAHATGFVKDPTVDPVSPDRYGLALYSELRTSTKMSVGLEAMFTKSDDDSKQRLGATHKVLLPSDILLESELIFTRQRIPYGTSQDEIVHQLVGYVLASKFVTDAIQLDLGLGHYDENLRYRSLDRDCVDLNLHWYTTSHLELVLNSRLEAVNWFHGNTGAYAALQAHYRL